MEKVFVYGTLKRGKSNHRLLEASLFLGETLTREDFVLTTCGFPFAIPAYKADKNFTPRPVVGEVFEVDERAMKALDMLEGEGSFYHRRKVFTEDFGDVWMYQILSMNGKEYPLCSVVSRREKECWEF